LMFLTVLAASFKAFPTASARATTLETEQTRETPRDEKPRGEKGEPTEQPIIHKFGRTGFLIYTQVIHGYVKGGVGWEAMRWAYVMINSEVGAEGGVLCLLFTANIGKIRRYVELRERLSGAREEG
jgi:hypothetical protein